MQRIALIPAYCPEDRMTALVKELHGMGFTIVAVDDGSGAQYDAVFGAVQSFATVLRYQPNRGKGEALKHGLRYIRAHFQPPYTVVTADADGQHRTADIEKVCQTAQEHPDSLVLGKRPLDKTSPIKSRIGNGITRVLYHLTTGRKIYETQTGLRAFSDRLLPRFLDLPGHRYEYEIDMMLNASDLDIIETEIRTVYFDNNAGSHFRPIPDTVLLDKEFFRYKLPSIIAGTAGYLLFVILAAVTKTWLLPCIGTRVFSLLLKHILDKAIPFAEKPPVGRYLTVSLIILLCDTAATWGLVTIGMNVFLAKLLSAILMIGVSIVLRMIIMKFKFPKTN